MPARKQAARPHALLYPIAHRDDGTPVMVADRVAEALRLGASHATAAARAGVSRQQLDAWLRAGNRHSAALAAGTRTADDLSSVELAELALANTAEQALAQLELNLLAQLEVLSRGHTATTTTERTDASGATIDRTERAEVRLPDSAVIRWRLERRLPEQWGPRTHVEHSGHVEVDVATRAAELADALRNAQGGGQPKGG
jgi:hypothetical protein